MRGVDETEVPGEGPRTSWRGLLALFVVIGLVAGAVGLASGSTATPPGSTHAAVLNSAESTVWACSEVVARGGSETWSNDSESLDHLHLPRRGRLHVISDASAVFTAHGVTVRLGPAMPCTAG